LSECLCYDLRIPVVDAAQNNQTVIGLGILIVQT